jgi:hypothetical protein
MDNTGTDVWITGVQLEVGSIATDFAHEDYGTTLIKCRRYFWRRTRNSGTDHLLFAGKINTTTVADLLVTLPVRMRAGPTMAVSAVDDFAIRHLNTVTTTTNVTAAALGQQSVLVFGTVSSGLTAGQGCILAMGTDGDYIEFSAEL